MNPQKQKGDRAEREFVKWAKANGYPNAERIRAGWEEDRGDIDLGNYVASDGSEFASTIVIEVKSAKALRINDWLDELHAENLNADSDDGWLVVRRPGQTDPGSWWAVKRVRDALG